MNAAVQALSNCPPLREYFRSYLPSVQASRDANGLPPVKKPVSDAFQELLTKIWSNQQIRGNALGPTLFSYVSFENHEITEALQNSNVVFIIRVFHNQFSKVKSISFLNFCRKIKYF